MQAVITSPPGGFANTKLGEATPGTIGPGEILVKIRSVGLNPADYYQVEGSYPGGPKPPFTPGRDAAGVVIAGNGTIPTGSEVIVLQTSKIDLVNGTLCQQQKFREETLAPLPAGWSLAEGSAAPLVYQTAWQALVDCGGLCEGKIVAITGASGGVGSAATQLAKGLGAKVVALSRAADKRERLLSIGADYAFDPTVPKLRDKIFDAIGKKGVDLVIENVGGASLGESVRLLGQHGRVSVVGMLAGIDGVVPIPSLMFKQVSIHGVVVYGYSPAEAHEVWKKILETLAKVKARPIIDSDYPLAQFDRAFDRLRASPFGKVLVTMP